jgi:large subunit ribosomal protein L28
MSAPKYNFLSFFERNAAMARQCEVTGKKRLIGNCVSHANNKTKRVFNVNIRTMRVFSEVLKRYVSMKLTPSGMRTLEHKGGVDAWLLDQKPSTLSTPLRKIRELIDAAKKAA